LHEGIAAASDRIWSAIAVSIAPADLSLRVATRQASVADSGVGRLAAGG